MVKVASFLNSVPGIGSAGFSSGLDLHPLKPKARQKNSRKRIPFRIDYLSNNIL